MEHDGMRRMCGILFKEGGVKKNGQKEDISKEMEMTQTSQSQRMRRH